MENLTELSKSSNQLKHYIEKTLKTKEDFDTELQIEDLAALQGIEEDLLQYATIITVNDKGIPVYNDGIHGIMRVFNSNSKYPEYKAGDIFLVDDIVFSDFKDGYTALGDWIKLN